MPVGYWVRPGLDAKTAASGRANTGQYSLGPLPSASCRTVSCSRPLPSRETLQDSEVGPAPAPMEFLLWAGSRCMGSPARPPRVESLFLQSCGAPALQPHRPSKPNALRALRPDARPSGQGAEQVLRTLWWENFCDAIAFQPVGRSPGGCRI